ncbi:SRPBCC domain-containing protein [Devosia sp.]|uniref:SRPBCC family protein n=1 Tax=Devosia sp. TaxID=1871048 RepID=UPI003264BF66
MSDQNFTTSFTVDQSPEQVFAAINDVRAWWEGDTTGDTDRLGGEFTYRYQDMHTSTQQITQFVPGQKIVWHVVDASLNFVQDKTEWTSTDIVFDITARGDQTEVRFTHVGLVNSVECFNDCSGAWTYYITNSLQAFIKSSQPVPA